MAEIGRRIYYLKINGQILVDTGERSGDVVGTTVEQDFEMYTELLKYDRNLVGTLELSYGAHKQDFQEATGYTIDPQSGEILFSYAPATSPTPPMVPLSVQIEQQKQRIEDLELMFADLIAGGQL